jgi:hypothetical protein
MKTCGGADVQTHVFLKSERVERDWSASRPGRFIPEERASGTHWTGGYVGPRASLENMENTKFLTLPGLELWFLGSLARSQLLYRLRHHGSVNAGGTYSNHWVNVTVVHS